MIFPLWQSFTPEFANENLARLLPEAEIAIVKIEQSAPESYDEFFTPLNDSTRELWDTWSMVSHMLGVMNSESWRKVDETWRPKIVEFSLRVGQSKPLYEIAKKLAAIETDPVKKRVLIKRVESAERSGVALEGDSKVRFNEITASLAKLGSEFRNAVIDATDAYKFEKDGKTWTIDDANYFEAMRECEDRIVRENLYRARSTRAPENVARIKKILSLRSELAGILGFGSYAEVSLASKCAPSIEAVDKMIDDLDKATKERSDEELKELREFAANFSPAPVKDFMPWDGSFYAEKLRQKSYDYSEEDLKKHLEFTKVLAGLFKLTKTLFGVEVVEVKGAEKPETWHKDVRFFAVKENGEDIAYFYVDPYIRPGLKSGGAWMNSFRDLRYDYSRQRKIDLPLAVLVLNQKGGDDDLMTMREVETLFHEFGHALQHMLTTVKIEEVAGLSLVEWDAVEIASQFMENWCLDDRAGIEIPEDLKKKVLAAKNFRAATACRRQLAFAKTDLELHRKGSVSDPDKIKTECFKHFGMPFVEGDGFLNSFTHIFTGGYAAGYYGYKWSEVMSADCYGAFEEAGLKDIAAVGAVGKSFRSTVLSLGGSKSAYEVFRLFRLREPSIEPLLRQTGLKK
jgi:oligopeptidase A